MRNYISMMRLDHWHKNLFAVPGILAAWKYHELNLLDLRTYAIACLALLICSLTSSVNYIINELLDAKHDQFHPVKHKRPAAQAQIKLPIAIGLIATLLVGIFTVSIKCLPATFTYCIVAFLVSGLFYNVPPIRLKDVPFLDTIVESFNNPVRLALGWFCYGGTVLPPSTALIAYWCLGGFMMTAKRFAEYSVFEEEHKRELYRKSFKVYTKERLINYILFWVSLFSSMFGIFVVRINMNAILVFPFVSGFFVWYMKLAFESDSIVKDPEKVFKKPLFFLYSLSVFAAIVAILFLGDRLTILNWLKESDSFIILGE
ncbi:UbiA family prenyltransferase [Candidatus Hydrogenedentota bacterium]